jgi:ferredoxin
MRIVVDLTRCQGYAQCASLAPESFRMIGDEALMFDPAPSDDTRVRVLRAAAACPVQAIAVDTVDGAAYGHAPTPEKAEGLRRNGRIVIVGASLAGLRAAETLRREGFSGSTAVTDIEIAGTTIAKGHPVVLVLASGNRDPECVPHPDRFDPDRANNQHLAFGSGVHYCFGAPLARLEAQIALTQFARRVQNPRLVVDPPPYRPSPVLRGPIHLMVEYDGVAPASLGQPS